MVARLGNPNPKLSPRRQSQGNLHGAVIIDADCVSQDGVNAVQNSARDVQDGAVALSHVVPEQASTQMARKPAAISQQQSKSIPAAITGVDTDVDADIHASISRTCFA